MIMKIEIRKVRVHCVRSTASIWPKTRSGQTHQKKTTNDVSIYGRTSKKFIKKLFTSTLRHVTLIYHIFLLILLSSPSSSDISSILACWWWFPKMKMWWRTATAIAEVSVQKKSSSLELMNVWIKSIVTTLLHHGGDVEMFYGAKNLQRLNKNISLIQRFVVSCSSAGVEWTTKSTQHRKSRFDVSIKESRLWSRINSTRGDCLMMKNFNFKSQQWRFVRLLCLTSSGMFFFSFGSVDFMSQKFLSAFLQLFWEIDFRVSQCQRLHFLFPRVE